MHFSRAEDSDAAAALRGGPEAGWAEAGLDDFEEDDLDFVPGAQFKEDSESDVWSEADDADVDFNPGARIIDDAEELEQDIYIYIYIYVLEFLTECI